MSAEYVALRDAHKILVQAYRSLQGSLFEAEGGRVIMRVIDHLLDQMDEVAK